MQTMNINISRVSRFPTAKNMGATMTLATSFIENSSESLPDGNSIPVYGLEYRPMPGDRETRRAVPKAPMEGDVQ